MVSSRQPEEQSQPVLTQKELQILERILGLAKKQEYAKVTLVIERGVLRKIEGPAPTILLK